MIKLRNLFITLVIAVVCVMLPHATRAAALSFSVDPAQVYAGDVFVAQLNLDTQGKKINVVDGSVYFDSSSLEVEDVSTGGSVFDLWTRAPIYDNQSGKISFTGGTTAGFSGSSGNVLKIVFYAKYRGQVTLVVGVNSQVFLADGRGTEVAPHLNNSLISIANPPAGHTPVNQWDKILAADKTPPQNLEIILGKDASVFNGQSFISFSATDNTSGIGYYAVKEGSGEFVQTESPYVLKDQSVPETITVKAVNKAGNFTTKDYAFNPNPPKGLLNVWVVVIALILLVNLAWALVFYKTKKNNKK